MKTFAYFPIVVAGVCMTVLTMTADAIKVDHPKFNKGSSSSSIVPGSYIITFTSKQTSAGSTFAQSFHDEFKGVPLKVKQDYKHDLFSGVSVKIDTTNDELHASALKTILDRADVQSVTPVRIIPRPRAFVTKKKKGDKKVPSILPHAMTQVDDVHTKLKNKGKGVLVAVVDTGVDYLNPALGGGFGPGHKVIKGYDLVGDAYTGSNTPVPDSDPLDNCGAASGASGHGTHVSGIIGGYSAADNFTGVAPEASLAMYRVFGCNGDASNDVILKALLMAYDGGADVINLSLGSTNAWGTTSDAEAEVVNKIVAKGVNVVISAGNSGSQGIYTVGQPSTSTDAFSIASIENDYYVAKDFTATGISKPILYTPASEDTIVDGQVVIADKNFGESGDSCTPAQISPSVKGKIALIERGTCTFAAKALNVQAAGAVGAIIFNNVPGSISASVPGVKIPVVTISNADGLALVAAIKKGTVSIKFNHAGSLQPIEDAGAVSSFSSLGAESELNFKPNIAGPGGNIYSTLPRYLGSYGVMSGTSMASPYVAGSIALYISANGKKNSVNFVHEHFQNYAQAAKVYNSTTIDSPVRQGAGLVQVYDAITQKTHISPAQISFNDTTTTKYRTKTITITNRGSKTISYEVKNDVATGISPYDVANSGYTPLEPAVNSVAKASLRFSTKAFKLAPGHSRKITVTVTPPKTNPKNHVFYGGYIHIVSKNQASGKDLKVPYFGVVGSQKDLPIYDDKFPLIIDQSGNEYTNTQTFTYDRNATKSFPTAVLRLLTPSKVINADLIDVKTNKVIGAFQTGLTYVGRNFITVGQGTTVYTQLPWDGTYVPNSIANAPFPIPAPSGTYKWRFSALKLMGNPSNKKDWEVWTSGPIVVKN